MENIFQAMVANARANAPSNAELLRAEARGRELSGERARKEQDLDEALKQAKTEDVRTGRGADILDAARKLVFGETEGAGRVAAAKADAERLRNEVDTLNAAITLQQQVVAEVRDRVSNEVSLSLRGAHQEIVQGIGTAMEALDTACIAEQDLFAAIQAEKLRPALDTAALGGFGGTGSGGPRIIAWRSAMARAEYHLPQSGARPRAKLARA